MLTYETQARHNGFTWVVGIDEAGRGPLAGPVVASAVVLKSPTFDCSIKDSKKMTALQRERAFVEIFQNAYVGIGVINEAVIDEINILQATYAAMTSAVYRLRSLIAREQGGQVFSDKDVVLLIDGNGAPKGLPYTVRPIVGGDGCSLSIACASIVAKVYRDRLIGIYDRLFPQYGFLKHKGYPTVEHRRAIAEHGYCPIHRRSFAVKIL